MKNILEDIEYIEPKTDLPIPDDMCKDCVSEINKILEKHINSEKNANVES